MDDFLSLGQDVLTQSLKVTFQRTCMYVLQWQSRYDGRPSLTTLSFFFVCVSSSQFATSQPTFSQLRGFKIRLPTLLNHVQFADLLILSLWNFERAGRVGVGLPSRKVCRNQEIVETCLGNLILFSVSISSVISIRRSSAYVIRLWHRLETLAAQLPQHWPHPTQQLSLLIDRNQTRAQAPSFPLVNSRGERGGWLVNYTTAGL